MKIQIIKFESVDSTNNVALRRIKKGKIKPTLIIAKSQKKGRGQYGRKWISHRGNIFMTVYFSLKRKIEIKTLSKKVYKLIKKSLEKFVNEKITINYNNNKFFIIGIGINLVKGPKINNKQVSFLQKYNNNRIKKSDIYKKIKNNFEKFI